jgi:hypothetical protein
MSQATLLGRYVDGHQTDGAGSGKVLVEAAAVAEYLKTIKAKMLEASRCEVTNSIRATDIKRLSRLANSFGKGWPQDPGEQTPYSFRRNVANEKQPLGGEPVREWLKSLPSREDRKRIGEDI